MQSCLSIFPSYLDFLSFPSKLESASPSQEYENSVWSLHTAQAECKDCFYHLSQLCLQPFDQEPLISTVRYHWFSEINFIAWHHSWIKVKSSISFTTFLNIPGTLTPELMMSVEFSGFWGWATSSCWKIWPTVLKKLIVGIFNSKNIRVFFTWKNGFSYGEQLPRVLPFFPLVTF